MSDELSEKTCTFNVCCECPVCCCQDAKPPLTAARVKSIEDHLRERGYFTSRIFDEAGYIFPTVDAHGFCVFHDKKTKHCLVHHVKPETCVAGPVTFDIDYQTGKVEWFLKKASICALAGRLAANKEQLREHFKIARQKILELVAHLDAGSLRTVLKIEEPQTIKIGEEVLPCEIAEKLGTM